MSDDEAMAYCQRELVKTRLDALRKDDRIDELEAALHKIVSWSEAYPLDIFPEPDFKKAHELLQAGGMTLDAISAHCMRHVVEGVGKIAKAALEGAA